MKFLHIFLSVVALLISNIYASNFSSCDVNAEHIDGDAIEYTSSVIDYTLGSSIKHSNSVIDKKSTSVTENGVLAIKRASKVGPQRTECLDMLYGGTFCQKVRDIIEYTVVPDGTWILAYGVKNIQEGWYSGVYTNTIYLKTEKGIMYYKRVITKPDYGYGGGTTETGIATKANTIIDMSYESCFGKTCTTSTHTYYYDSVAKSVKGIYNSWDGNVNNLAPDENSRIKDLTSPFSSSIDTYKNARLQPPLTSTASYSQTFYIGKASAKGCDDGYTKVGDECHKSVNYDFYQYSCPDEYDITDEGFATFTKNDSNTLTDNQEALSSNANSSTPPQKNCKKTVYFKHYAYTCPDEENPQGFNWVPEDEGYKEYTKLDPDTENDDSVSLSASANPILPPVSNCSRQYQECKIECPDGMILDSENQVCHKTYQKDCEDRGFTYNTNLEKCDILNNCPLDSYATSESPVCMRQPECTTGEYGCAEYPNFTCEEGFVYSYSSQACEKITDCDVNQIATETSEYCQSLAQCNDGDIQTSAECIHLSQAMEIPCVGLSKEGNTCYLNNTGEEVLIQKKPLVEHKISYGNLSPDVFGSYTQATCSGADCTDGIINIEGKTNSLCFEKSDGTRTCLAADGCTFSGNINASSYISSIWIDDYKNISAQDSNGNIYSNGVTSSCKMHGMVGYKGRKYPISGVKNTGEDLEFWNAYFNEGYLGKIKFLDSIEQEDIEAGYKYENTTPFEMMEDGFGLIEAIGDETFAISSGTMSTIECDRLAAKYSFSVHPPISAIPEIDRLPYDIVMNTTGGNFGTNNYVRYYETWATKCPEGTIFDYGTRKCGLERTSPEASCPPEAIDNINGTCYIPYPEATENKCVLVKRMDPMDIDKIKFSQKTDNTENVIYQCSPIICGADYSCQTASCRDDLKGDVFSSTRTVPLETDCLDDVCDANKEYYEWCGKDVGCGDIKGVQELANECYKVICPEGGYDEQSAKCFKWQCPNGYTMSGETCVKN